MGKEIFFFSSLSRVGGGGREGNKRRETRPCVDLPLNVGAPLRGTFHRALRMRCRASTLALLLLCLLAYPTVEGSIVVTPGDIASGCTPHCVTHCQAPRPPPPDCRVIATVGECTVTCEDPDHAQWCTIPACNATAPGTQCPADSCPTCEVHCPAPRCRAGIHDCVASCPDATCTWECVLPATIPAAVCDIRCEHPACGASVVYANRTRSSVLSSGSVDVNRGLHFVVLFMFAAILFGI